MPNQLTTSVAQYKETFKEARLFIYEKLGNNREAVLKIEEAHNSIYSTHYYIQFIESKGISFYEALVYCEHNFTIMPSYSFYVYFAIVECFRRIEINNLTFVPF